MHQVATWQAAFVRLTEATDKLRDVFQCSCPGYTAALGPSKMGVKASREADRCCKHVRAFMLKSLEVSRSIRANTVAPATCSQGVDREAIPPVAPAASQGRTKEAWKQTIVDVGTANMRSIKKKWLWFRKKGL